MTTSRVNKHEAFERVRGPFSYVVKPFVCSTYGQGRRYATAADGAELRPLALHPSLLIESLRLVSITFKDEPSIGYVTRRIIVFCRGTHDLRRSSSWFYCVTGHREFLDNEELGDSTLSAGLFRGLSR